MSLKQDSTLFYRFSRYLIFLYYRIFFRFQTYGVVKNWCSGPAIIAANHTSFLDPPALGIAVNRGIHYLARESLFRFPVFGRMLRAYHVHPLKASNATASMKAVSNLLSQDKQVVIFPEGARQIINEIGTVKSGIGMLVQRNQCFVIPVYIAGAYDIWNRKRKLPKLFGKMICVVGSAIHWDEFKHLDKKEAQRMIVERWKESMDQLKKWYESGMQGSPP